MELSPQLIGYEIPPTKGMKGDMYDREDENTELTFMRQESRRRVQKLPDWEAVNRRESVNKSYQLSLYDQDLGVTWV